MNCRIAGNSEVEFSRHHTLIVGAGAAGMNCAKKLYEYLAQMGVRDPERQIAVITRGLALGTSRMSGSDKQTYYKLGTSATVADSAADFADSLTAGGCCHRDLALAEGIGSLRGFHNLVEAGVPFPHDASGAYIGYKTDHDPCERATSAGPKTSRCMSECLEEIVRRYGIEIFDCQEVVELVQADANDGERISGVLCIDRNRMTQSDAGLRFFEADNLVLAAGGPGGLYSESVYPHGQIGLHGAALKAGLAAENLTESQFGLASIKFRWNVSGSYMQAVPRIYSTDADGGDARDFLAGLFPSIGRMTTAIFLKGYQWPFDPDRIMADGSSLIDLAVHNETVAGRRVYLDFLRNPIGKDGGTGFDVRELEPEARRYLESAGAVQGLPIERLEALNPPAIEIYGEHDIDLKREPLEIAVCAQHCNGGFAVDHWWMSNIAHTFVVGEMAGTHGVKRPGGSALNAGQVGAQRAAEYIANRFRGRDSVLDTDILDHAIEGVMGRFNRDVGTDGLDPLAVIAQIRRRTSRAAGHIRRLDVVRQARREALDLCDDIRRRGFDMHKRTDPIAPVQAEQLAVAGLAVITAVCHQLELGSGSRGSHLVVADEGAEIDKDLPDPVTGERYRILPEKKSLRDLIQRVILTSGDDIRFDAGMVPVRVATHKTISFEPAWAEFISKKIYEQ